MRSGQTSIRYFTRSINTTGVEKAALVLALRRADRTEEPVKPIKMQVKIARGISHAIELAKWKVINRLKFSGIEPPGM